MVIRWLKDLFRRKRWCYRCGGRAYHEYMSLPYCPICYMIVSEMAHLIPMGPPVGFPGGPPGDPEWKKRMEG